MKRLFSLLLCWVLVLQVFVSIGAGTAYAKTSRSAVIVSVTGSVTITKAGGSKGYPAFANMTLNQGDHISTASGSNVTVQITDSEHEVTIGEHTDIYVSKLSDDGGSKQNGFKMWVGSMWNKVKSLGGSDEYSAETSTSVMGVRGTTFLVAVNKDTGETTLLVASGIVRSDSRKGDADQDDTVTYVDLYPSQQITIDFSSQGKDLKSNVEVIDLDSFVQKADPKVLEQLILNKSEIQKENEKLFEQVKQGNISDRSVLQVQGNQVDRVKQNADNLGAALLQKGIELNKFSQQEAQRIATQANSNLPDDKKIDLTKKVELDKQAGFSEEQLRQQELEKQRKAEEQKRQQDEQKRQQDELKKQLDEQLKRLETEKKRLEEANKAAEEARRKLAEQALLSTLSQQQQQQFIQNQNQLNNPTPTPTPTPTTPTTPPNSNTGGNSGGDTTPDPDITISLNPITTESLAITGQTVAGATVQLTYRVGSSSPNNLTSVTAGTSGAFTATLTNKLPAGAIVTATASRAGYVTKSNTATVVAPFTVERSGDQLIVKGTGFTGDRAIKGAQLHLVHKEALSVSEGSSTLFTSASNSAQSIRSVSGSMNINNVLTTGMKETIFAGIYNVSANSSRIELANGTELVRLKLTGTLTEKVHVVAITFVDSNGNAIYSYSYDLAYNPLPTGL